MASDRRAYINVLNKRANSRIGTLKNSPNNLYASKTEQEIERLYFKTGKLNNVSDGNLRIGALDEKDEQAYINALENFLNNPINSIKGQREVITAKGYETFTENHPSIEVTEDQYTDLVRIWESDTFQKFKENFGTYSGVVDEMAKNPKGYKQAISFLAGVNRSDKENGKYAQDGELDVKAFIDAWRAR